MSKYFLGIDGGQTATVALIGNADGRVVGAGKAGPCTDVAIAVGGSVADACRTGGLQAPIFEAACLGLSGGAEGKLPIVERVVRATHMQVTHDAAIALDGALAGEPGVIVIAGTGSIAFGRDAQGRESRAGGWGYIFGDEGSAFDIVRQAIRAGLRYEEGWGPSTALVSALLDVSGAANMNELLHWAYSDGFPRQRLANWAPMIETAANSGDAIAAEILRGAGTQLAMIATAVQRQLFKDVPARVSFAGGVYSSARVLEAFQMLCSLDGSMEITPPRHSPAAGALIGAYRLAGRSVTITGAPEFK